MLLPYPWWRRTVQWLNVALLIAFAGYVFGLVLPSTVDNAPIGGWLYNIFASLVESVPFLVICWSAWKDKRILLYVSTAFRIIVGFICSVGLFFVMVLLNPDFRAYAKQFGVSWF